MNSTCFKKPYSSNIPTYVQDEGNESNYNFNCISKDYLLTLAGGRY